MLWLSYEWCRELHELKASSTAGASNDKDSPAGNTLRDEGTDSAVQLAAAQDACSVAKNQAASLQKTVQQLTGGPLVSSKPFFSSVFRGCCIVRNKTTVHVAYNRSYILVGVCASSTLCT